MSVLHVAMGRVRPLTYVCSQSLVGEIGGERELPPKKDYAIYANPFSSIANRFLDER